MISLASVTSSGMTLDDLTRVLLIGSIVLLVAVAAVRLSVRSGLPSLLIYLGIGLALGNAGLGIQFDDASITRVLGYAALVLILAEGGLTTSWGNIKDSVAPAALLSTVGVAVSVIVVAVAAHTLLPLSWTISLLVGAIVTSTDAAAVFAVLRNVPLPKRLSGMLEAEAGFNDAPVVILVVAFSAQGVPGGDSQTWWQLLLLAAVELVGGAVVGIGVGVLGGQLLRRVAGGSSALFSIGVISLTVLAYAAGAAVHVSGFLATYLCALVLANMGLPNRTSFQSFGSALGWLAQIGLFVLLGLLADPRDLGAQLVPAIVIGLVLLLVARPLSVFASVSWFRMSVARPGLPVLGRPARGRARRARDGAAHRRHARHRVDLRPRLRARRRLHDRAGPDAALGGEAARSHRAGPLGRRRPREHVAHRDRGRRHPGVGRATTRACTESPSSSCACRPGPTSRSSCAAARASCPTPHTTIRHGDRLLVVATSNVRSRTEQRIRAVSRDGRLAGWP